MGKLDEFKRLYSGNVGESIGAGREVIHRVSPPPAPAISARMEGVTRSKDAAEIAVDRIAPDPDQPREDFDEEALGRLAESLRTRGQLQPIRVRWDEGRGLYVIVAGERRWRAARLAGLATVSCVVAGAPSTPGELLVLQLVENALREDLKPIEQARAFRSLMDANGWSTRQLARELAIVQPAVVRSLSLLDLPDAVQAAVTAGDIAPSVAYEVSKVTDPAEQAALAERAVAGGLNRGEVVAAVRRSRGRPAGKTRGGPRGKGKPARKVTARTFKAGRGKVTVEDRRGLDGATVLAMLREAVAVVEREVGGDVAGEGVDRIEAA